MNRLTKGSTSSEESTSQTLTGDSRLQTPDSIAAIILAAGRSTRMGSFKPLLPFGASTVIETCIDNLRGGGVETVVVVVGHRAEDIKERLKNRGVTFAFNSEPDSEMSASIVCAVAQLPVEIKAVLITPADHPAVPPEVITTLISEWKLGGALVVPTWNDRGGHPVLIDLSFRYELLRLNPNLGLRALFDAHQNQVRRVPVNSNSIARDMDTWDDYLALHEAVFGAPPSEPVP